jgi:hypothetical protein
MSRIRARTSSRLLPIGGALATITIILALTAPLAAAREHCEQHDGRNCPPPAEAGHGAHLWSSLRSRLGAGRPFILP